MRIVASGAVLRILTAVSAWTQILRFVMTVDARVEDRHAQEMRMNASVRFMASSTLALSHRRMADLVTEVASMTNAALMHQVRSNLHASARVMAPATSTLDEGWMG